jgi:hypothetical protein
MAAVNKLANAHFQKANEDVLAKSIRRQGSLLLTVMR